MRVMAVVAERRTGVGESTAAALKPQEVELADELLDKEVLVRVVACGVCRADLDCVDQKSPFPLPAVLGHEGTGIVERVGARVEKVKPGDHVIMAFPNDGTCPSCLEGRPRQCIEGGKLMWGGKRYDGSESAWSRDGAALAGHMFQQSAFATHAIATEMNCVVVPDEVPLETFVIGCGVMTGAGGVLNVLKPEPGSSIVVLGGGRRRRLGGGDGGKAGGMRDDHRDRPQGQPARPRDRDRRDPCHRSGHRGHGRTGRGDHRCGRGLCNLLFARQRGHFPCARPPEDRRRVRHDR